MKLRTNFYHRRRALGFTQERLAKKIHYSTKQIQQWEMGKCKVPFLVDWWLTDQENRMKK